MTLQEWRRTDIASHRCLQCLRGFFADGSIADWTRPYATANWDSLCHSCKEAATRFQIELCNVLRQAGWGKYVKEPAND